MTKETRKEAYEFIKPLRNTRQNDILDAMGTESLTAREIALKMGFGNDMNMVRPRITELAKKGKIKAVDARLCPVTKRRVAVFKVVDLDGQWMDKAAQEDA